MPIQPGGKIGGTVGHRVDDGDMPGAQREHGMRDSRPRTARSQLHNPLQGDIGQPAGEGRREPGDIRVVPDRPATVEHDGVDRTERRGLRSELVEVLDDQLLAGVRDVQPVEAEVPCGAYEVAHRLRTDTEPVDVDQPVQTAQALPVGLPLVQRGTERRADAGSDEADEIRVLGHGGPPVDS